MALSGPEAMKSLDDAVRDIRSEEDEIGKRLTRRAERVAKMREAEADLFAQLAQTRLEPATRSEITGVLSRAETQAREMIDRLSTESQALEEDLHGLDRAIADNARKRQRLLEEIDTHQSELKALSAKIAQTVEKDPEYEDKRQTAEHLRAVAKQSLEKTEQAEADREEKGRPYREDTLFMYLWEAGYGTRNYKGNNLARWLDGMVARLIGYDKARPNFAMLNEIPLRLREHADRQREAAQKAEDALAALETRAIDKAGGTPVREALERAQAEIEKIDAEMVDLEDERDDKARTYRHKVEGRDPKFKEATDMLAERLSRQDVADLLDAARHTATGADDAIVAKIEDARLRIAEEEEDSAEDKARLKVLGARRRELEDIEYEFKRSRFDDPRSSFHQDDLAGDLLNEFLRGAITAASYWGAWQKSQRWRPGTSDWGGGFGLPRNGGLGGLGGGLGSGSGGALP